MGTDNFRSLATILADVLAELGIDENDGGGMRERTRPRRVSEPVVQTGRCFRAMEGGHYPKLIWCDGRRVA